MAQEDGSYRAIEELAAAEKINPSYVCRIMRLTLLAPDLVASILEGRQIAGVTMVSLMKPLPAAWDDQEALLANQPRDVTA
jgi:hypothetical protein